MELAGKAVELAGNAIIPEAAVGKRALMDAIPRWYVYGALIPIRPSLTRERGAPLRLSVALTARLITPRPCAPRAPVARSATLLRKALWTFCDARSPSLGASLAPMRNLPYLLHLLSPPTARTP